jgi:Fe-S cluster biogenesis protein NfuA
MNIDGITSVFYGPDFITITKLPDVNWAHVKPEVFSLITETVNSGGQIINVPEGQAAEVGQHGAEEDSLAYREGDSEVVGMIKELLETRIRPAIQEDGGDIEYRGFEGGNVLLKLRGACRTCDSSTVTLKNGIEGMLMHYVSLIAFGGVKFSRIMANDFAHIDRGSQGSCSGDGQGGRNRNARVCEIRGEA